MTIRPTSGDAGVENDRIVFQNLFSRSSVKRESMFPKKRMKWNLGANRIEMYSILGRNRWGWLGSKGASQKRPVQKDGGINKKAGLCSTIKKRGN